MTEELSPELQDELRDLTKWPGTLPGLWQRALRRAGQPGGEGGSQRWHKVLRLVTGWRAVAVAASVVVIVGVSASILPALSRSRAQAKWATKTPREQTTLRAPVYSLEQVSGVVAGETPAARGVPVAAGGRELSSDATRHLESLGYVGTERSDAAETEVGRVDNGGEAVRHKGALARTVQSAGPASAPPESSPLPDRQVIRKATVQLATKDVRATFLRAAHLLSEARGEYVENSSLTGTGDRAEANLTLRVAADRLDAVLNDLRELAEVRAEQSTGEDVTAQVVDLEARLRNEQRVETELLQLLEKRDNAPLKEVLELRDNIARVRQYIEQLTAQRQRLGRLVSLATVLVIIRPTDAPVRVETGLGGYLLRCLHDAWHVGATFLFDTFAVLMSIFVGGLIWWILLIVALLTWRAYRRRAATSA